MPLSVQNQIPCAGGFGYQRIHVILNKHDDKLDGLEEICFMEKLITRKEAAEILGISIATLDAARNNGLISYLIHASVDPKTVQYLAGHESSKITMDIYAKVKYNRPDELVRSMNCAFASWDAAQ